MRESGEYSIAKNIKGATGTKGTNGTNGSNGSNGSNGATWRNGSGVPSNGTGVDGDYYLNNANGDVYLRASGTYSITANIKGAAGTAGTNGTNGAIWRNGSSATSSGTGVEVACDLNEQKGYVRTRWRRG